MAFKYSPVFNNLDLLLAKLSLTFNNYYFLRKQTSKSFFPIDSRLNAFYLSKCNDVDVQLRENAQYL